MNTKVEKGQSHDENQATVKVGEVETTGAECKEFRADPCGIVIFGASGDLAKRKLLPSLYSLAYNRLLSNNFFILGVARSKMGDDAFRKTMEDSVREAAGEKFDGIVWSEFAKKIYYKPMDFGNKDAYAELNDRIAGFDREYGTQGNRIFYLATPPSVYQEIIECLGAAGMSDETKGWSRLVVEKPYGRDLKSAIELNKTVSTRFREDQVYRIDHYLGKETVQNILMLRFANVIFEPIWNRRYVDHVQITVAETLGVEKRAGFYEQAGVLRDVFQNHMLQVLSLVTMEPPSVYESELVRNERIKVFRALRPLPLDNLAEHLVTAQYVEGEIGGKIVPGYREEEGVDRHSQVPTYSAMKVFIDNWRWQDVPFYLRSGKRLKERFSQVTIQFKKVPHLMFKAALGADYSEIGPNALILRIQPDERVQLKFHTKNPGSRVNLRDVLMDFKYTEGYKGLMLEAYERVLLDCILGDKMLFVRSDGVEQCWAFLTPVLEAMEKGAPGSPDLEIYRAGTMGPIEAESWIKKSGRKWNNG